MSSVVGIDFGFQNSVIAAAGRGGVDVILNGNSNRLNPSLVGFDQSRKMGEHALSGVSSNYRNTVKGMKRLVGLAYDDPRAKREMEDIPVTFVPIPHQSGGPDSIGVEVPSGEETVVVPIEAVAGMMIKHMGEIAAEKAAQASDAATIQSSDANKSLTSPLFPQDWVIAIPNYYTDAQRRALLAGCEMVGISGIQRLMHENTATALAYGIFKDLKKEFSNQEKPTHVMFIDMGSTAYTVSIAAFEPGKLIVKSAFCDPDLGGRDFDMAIAKWIATKFEEKFKNKLSGKPMETPKTRLKLLAAAEKAKKELSPKGIKETTIHLEMLMDDLDFSASLKAEEYEELCKPLLDRLAAPIQKALAEAKLNSAAECEAVEIVGGSTRIGCVKRRLMKIMEGIGKLSTTMNADEAVARGAALQSAILSPRFKVLPYDIQEAQPYPIQLAWDPSPVTPEQSSVETSIEGVVDDAAAPAVSNQVIMFDRGLSFPVVRRVTLKRKGNFSVRSLYDAAAAAQYGLSGVASATDIATFEIIMPDMEEEKKVRVNVKEDIHGIIQLSSAQMVEEEEAPAEGGDANTAEEEEKKKKIKKTALEFKTRRPLEWTQAEMIKFNEAEVAMSNNDRVVRETATMRNSLESYIYEMRDKVSSDSHLGPYGTAEEKDKFNALNEATENWLYEDGFDATKSVYAEKLQQLQALGNPMAMRFYESQNRPAAVQNLQGVLKSIQTWLQAVQHDDGSKYGHITDEERDKVRAKTDEVSAWMYEQLDRQGQLGVNVDPVLTVAQLNSKIQELNSTCNPIMRKPVPKAPAPTEKKDPPAGDKATEEAKKEENAEPMDGVEESAKKDDPPSNEGAPMDTTD